VSSLVILFLFCAFFQVFVQVRAKAADAASASEFESDRFRTIPAEQHLANESRFERLHALAREGQDDATVGGAELSGVGRASFGYSFE
jgi:hypothetical protein